MRGHNCKLKEVRVIRATLFISGATDSYCSISAKVIRAVDLHQLKLGIKEKLLL